MQGIHELLSDVVGSVLSARAERSLCLPVLFRLWRPRRKHIPKGKSDPPTPREITQVQQAWTATGL
jgi:hypothetical protein